MKRKQQQKHASRPSHQPSVSPKDLDRLRKAIVNKQPFISGTLAQSLDSFNLFFGKQESAHRINVASATVDQLLSLADECDPASFGRGNEDVLDETYRKAGKLDNTFFSTPFVPERTTLIDLIRDELLEGPEHARPISAELYKLNVYGEGSFFKAHQDTPRGTSMFGSLVVVYPTNHTGGALILRNRDEEWTFDSAQAVASQTLPSFGFIAFFSDVEHEVAVVESGHRVTLTYNLYYNDVPATPAVPRALLAPAPAPISNEALFESVLRPLLDNPKFMPSGGHLGFGLRHVYPVQKRGGFDHVYGLLKGSDAIIHRAARTLSLPSRLYLVYESRWEEDRDQYKFGPRPELDNLPSKYKQWDEYDVLVLVPTVPEDDALEGNEVAGDFIELDGAIFVRPPDAKRYSPENDVHWVTPYASQTRYKSTSLTFGNEAQMVYNYADLCLVIPIGKPGSRSVPPKTERPMKKEGRY
ncbi:hypothetical protein OF83DRAFT_1071034 [Amylostereum chailletii]|nr:hypothetical protein OF83DRAFT_1071034 [Amylostereum chailletii]